jgi:short-subunit dehydrogenase
VTRPARVILVTGASSGIGRAIAARAAREGDHLVLVARGRAALDDVAAECESLGAASVLVVPADVGVDADAQRAVDATVGRHGRIDGVMHCAGVAAYGRTEDVPAEVFDGLLRTNLTGSVNVARHVVPVLRRQREGLFVLVGSVIGHIAVPSMSPYVVSKWGVRALARQLKIENSDLPRLQVSYLAPGGVDTPIYEQAANYAGVVGRPPPPVAPPDRVARAAMRQFDRPRARSQVGVANDVMRFGFTALPAVYDWLVGPLFRVAAVDRTQRTEPTPGNVLSTRPGGNHARGDQQGALANIGRNLALVVADIRRGLVR